MKRSVAYLIIMIILAAILSGCAISGIARHSVEQSSEEFKKWTEMFQARLNKMPNEDITPFSIWLIGIIGDDKIRLPREGEELINSVSSFVNSKPDDYVYTRKDRARLMGAWDRLFIILYEETGNKGLGLLKKLIPAVSKYLGMVAL